MRYRGYLGAGRHAERSEEDRNQSGQLFDIFLLGFHHLEYDAVPFAHAFRVLGADVELNYLLPSTSAQPTAKETLNLLSEETRIGVSLKFSKKLDASAMTQVFTFSIFMIAQVRRL